MKTVIINGNEMSYEEAHRYLWNWLADNPTKNKFDFFDLNECNIMPHFECFACECVVLDKEGFVNCKTCPITWGTETYQYSIFCEADDNSKEEDIFPLYEIWHTEKDIEKRSSIARQIANMEWKEK